MEWIASLQGKVVGLDTAPLVYFIEENPTYLKTVRPFFEAMDRQEFQIITSIVTLLEVLVHPFRHGDQELAQQYREILPGAKSLTTALLSPDIAEEAAQLRATHRIRTPDAIQLATALQAGASSFVTNDARLPRLPDLELLIVDELKT